MGKRWSTNHCPEIRREGGTQRDLHPVSLQQKVTTLSELDKKLESTNQRVALIELQESSISRLDSISNPCLLPLLPFSTNTPESKPPKCSISIDGCLPLPTKLFSSCGTQSLSLKADLRRGYPNSSAKGGTYPALLQLWLPPVQRRR